MSARSLLAAPAAAYLSVQPAAAGVTAMSPGRLGAIVAALLGLTGVVIGALSLARPAGRFGTRSRRLVSLAAGLTAMALGALVVATSDSGIGTGNGRGGAFVALLLGLIGVAMAGLSLTRARRTG
ncbi:DUF6223 family protein [Streptomyces sp. NPDC053253]|uniref:DUF6223 family protein n=1 Tax=unclassified Streptomyces TaxID=2593676 RepID=UPI0037D8A1CC